MKTDISPSLPLLPWPPQVAVRVSAVRMPVDSTQITPLVSRSQRPQNSLARTKAGPASSETTAETAAIRDMTTG